MKVVRLKSLADLAEIIRPNYVQVRRDENLAIQGLYWPYQDSDVLWSMAKKRGGAWSVGARQWVFPTTAKAQDFLDALSKKYPERQIIDPISKPKFPLNGHHISRVPIDSEREGCLIELPLPLFADLSANTAECRFDVFKFSGKGKKVVALLTGSVSNIESVVRALAEQGATCDAKLAAKWKFATGSKLQVKVSGWAVQISCDLANPAHYVLAPAQKYQWKGVFPYGVKTAVSWDGCIHTTRKRWLDEWKKEILEAGLAWAGDDPEAELTVPFTFDVGRVSGWSQPAPNGYVLHAYQKEGAEFCAARGMRALLGDEMGIGKTAQAIAAAEATGMARVLVICPANARYVWEGEVRGWGAAGGIQHITSRLDKLDASARWHIATYDLLSVRNETWWLNDRQEAAAFVHALPKLAKEKQIRAGSYPQKVTLDEPLDGTPAFADPKRVASWEKMAQRLRGELLEQLSSAGPMLLILDEAHRAKNKEAKRTKAIQRLAAGESRLLMLTGTPLRNNEHEAAALLGLLDAEAAKALSKENGYTIRDVRDYLDHFMIRRTKAEVLPELPEKTRQRIDVGNLDQEQLAAYRDAVNGARQVYCDAIHAGTSESAARQAMQGGIEKARNALGIAKIRGGEVSDLILDVVEHKECCVVFCAHHQVSDELKVRLEAEGLNVAVVDGRTAQKARAEAERAFQAGRLDVFIGGINAAGEAITLTRAETVIFVELDWVPAALLQAEDRIHRIGQRSNCLVIQLIARLVGEESLDEVMVDLLGSKIARIGEVLGENTENIIAGGIQAETQRRFLGLAGEIRMPERGG